MRPLNRLPFLWLNIVIFSVLCSMAILHNAWSTHYVGNHVMPYDKLFSTTVILWLCALGFRLQFSPENQISRFIYEVLIGLFIFTLVLSGTGTLQYTPFQVIDEILVRWDARLHVDVYDLVAWLHQVPYIKQGLTTVYESLSLELLGVPLVLIFMRRYALLREYYTLILISATIGYSIYYFFPTIAPASALGGPYFSVEQYATGLKFNEIHHHLVPSTQEGGLISFPSFHVIWAWFLVYTVRCWKLLFIVLSCWNTVLVISCVLLGWHYAVDVIGSVGVIIVTHWIDRYFINGTRYFFRREY